MWGLGKTAKELAWSSHPGMVILVSELTNARVKEALSRQGITQIQFKGMNPVTRPHHFIAAFKWMAAGMEEGKEYFVMSALQSPWPAAIKLTRTGPQVEIEVPSSNPRGTIRP